MNQSERLKYAIAILAKTQSAFAEALGTRQSTIGSWVKRNSISADAAHKIKQAYPQLNLDWLLAGNGDMFIGDTHQTDAHPHNANAENEIKEEFPLIPYEIARKPNLDVLEYVSHNTLRTKYYPSFPMFPDVTLYYSVLQNAMSPRYEKGDVLAIAPLMNGGTIENGAPYIVDTYSAGFIFRLVYKHADYLECRPINTQSTYTPFDIPTQDVIRLYRVLGMIRVEG